MSTEVSLARRWQRCEDYYRDLWCGQSTYNPRGMAAGVCEGMRAFVERIAPAAIAEKIYPGNAHAWLILWKRERVRIERAVYLLCDRHGSRFVIRWRKDANVVTSETVSGIDSACWQRIVTWLDLQDQTEA